MAPYIVLLVDAGGAAAGPVRHDRRARRSRRGHALRLQDRPTTRTSASSATRSAALLVRRCSPSALLVAAAAARRLLCRRHHLVFIYGIVRALADGAGRLHRPGLAWATRPSSASAPTPTPTSRSRRALGAVGGRWRVLITAAGGVRRRPAGAAHDRHLPRDRDAGLRAHHPGGVQPLGARDRRLRRQAGGQAGRSSACRSTTSRSFYFLCLVFLVAGAVADAQPAALADRPRLGRHPRQRDRRAVHGHQPGALQDRWPSPTRRR